MADISNFVHKFRANPQEIDGTKPDGLAKIQKRNRPVVSCLPCRNRKSKCDREHPICGTCKGNGNTCVYRPSTKSVAKSTPQDRLAQLESLVLQLMHSKESESPEDQPNKVLTPPADSITNATDSAEDSHSIGASRGAFTNGVHGPCYVGPTHWEAVLDTINGLKSELAITDDLYADHSRNDKTRESLFTTLCPTNLVYVLSILPDRSTVDRLVSVYFNARILCMPTIHTPSFERMYEKFWLDNTSVPVLWISQLFSLLAIGSLIYSTADRSDQYISSVIPPRSQFFKAAAQCLVYANWERPQRYVVEALFFYTVAKTVAGVNPSCDLDEVWVLYGACVRQAYRLGYHREPSQIPGISVFDAEMRRRAWHVLCQFDIVGCLQHGLPCNIQDYEMMDTMKPRNLLDTDFDEDSNELPPPRKETEITAMVYFIAKGAMLDVLREMLHRQISKKTLTYDEDVMQLDRRMRDTYLAMPHVLRVKPISQSYSSPSWLILNRIKVDILYQKSLCVLHRQHLDGNPRHKYSVDTCVQAAMEILRHQKTVHTEAILGGQLTGNRWLVTSMHLPDFFLGAMILGFIICNFDPSQLGGIEAVEEMKMLMHSALAITNGIKASFREAARFSAAIEIILRKVEGPQLSFIDFDFQSFTGPSLSSLNTSPDSNGISGTDLGLQEFESYFDNADNINWAFIDAGMMISTNPANLEYNWAEPNLDTTWSAD